MASATAYPTQLGPDGPAVSTTALGRWSVINKQLPAVEQIKSIHVYDFDNTLFKTPLPNQKLWTGPTLGALATPNVFVNGGWWHDPRILAATGQGVTLEEPKAWSGCWNEKMAELVRLSMKQNDALCVLLTGRSEKGFGDLIKRMVSSKGLDFDLVSLKPVTGPDNQQFANTLVFKQIFLAAVMDTYKAADEIRIYEDRPKHVKGFRDFLTMYNKKQAGGGGCRGAILGEVVQVADLALNLDPVTEIAEVQRLINDHNAAVSQRPDGTGREQLMIKKTVYYTGYLIQHPDTQTLLTLAQIPTKIPDMDLKYHANTIMICSRPCPASLLEEVGGMGSKMRWEVTGLGCFQNRIWAASVRPLSATANVHTENSSPLVVLALRKGTRPVDAAKIEDWQPVPPDKAFSFETAVGEKILYRIEAEDASEDAYQSLFPHRKGTRRKQGEEDLRSRAVYNQSASYRNGHQAQLKGGPGPHLGRFLRGGGGPAYRGSRGQRGSSVRGRGGRGGGHQYRSLDDVSTRDPQGSHAQQVSYEDGPARAHQASQPQQSDTARATYSQVQYQLPYQEPQRGGTWPQGYAGSAFITGSQNTNSFL